MGTVAPNLTRTANALDQGGLALGFTINTVNQGRTADYKCYEGTLTGGGSTVVIDLFTDLGAYPTKGIIADWSATSTSNFSVQFSIDGTNYGDAITVRPSFPISFDAWLAFKKVKLTPGASDTPYQVLFL